MLILSWVDVLFQNYFCELKADKLTLKQRITQNWITHIPLLGSRFHVCGLKQSNLKLRCSIPWALQSLYSRYRIGEVESCGVYPRRMGWIEDPRCRFCSHPCETFVRLLNACPDTAAYCITHGISFDTLVNEMPENILRIAHFDAFLWRVLGCSHWHSNPSLDSILSDLEQKCKCPSDTTRANPDGVLKIWDNADVRMHMSGWTSKIRWISMEE